VVRGDVPKAELAAAQTVVGYKKLAMVEQAFRQLKIPDPDQRRTLALVNVKL